jgi:hypothetical protein
MANHKKDPPFEKKGIYYILYNIDDNTGRVNQHCNFRVLFKRTYKSEGKTIVGRHIEIKEKTNFPINLYTYDVRRE